MIEREIIVGSPFECFEVNTYIPIRLGEALDLSITNSAIYMIYALVIYEILIKTNIENGTIVPGRWQSVIEETYGAIVNMVQENIGDGKYVPMIWTLFMSIGIMNLVGIVPYTFTPTGHIIIGFGLSVSLWIGVTLLGFAKNGSYYISNFMLSGSPMALAPLLIPIELVSQMVKAVSLGLRLSANITAGHLLFAILSGFTWTMLTAGGIISIVSVFPFLVVVFITILEMAVALIQAFVFTTLTSIYISESLHAH